MDQKSKKIYGSHHYNLTFLEKDEKYSIAQSSTRSVPSILVSEINHHIMKLITQDYIFHILQKYLPSFYFLYLCKLSRLKGIRMYLAVCIRYARQYIQSDTQWKYKATHNGNTKWSTKEIQMLDATAKNIQKDIKDNMDHWQKKTCRIGGFKEIYTAKRERVR